MKKLFTATVVSTRNRCYVYTYLIIADDVDSARKVLGRHILEEYKSSHVRFQKDIVEIPIQISEDKDSVHVVWVGPNHDETIGGGCEED